jgi:lysyl-tRNA synthetase class II
VLKSPDTNPYPHKFQVTYDDAKFFEEFSHLKSGESSEDKVLTIAGRIYNKRQSGSKLIFYGKHISNVPFPRPIRLLEIQTFVPLPIP